MIVKCNCNNCSQHIEFESPHAGQMVKCPSCGMETRLYIPAPVSQAKNKAEATKEVPPLVKLRRNSNYKGGRLIMDLVLILTLAGGLVVFVACAVDSLPVDEAITAAASMLFAALCYSLGRAIFDIADKLLEK